MIKYSVLNIKTKVYRHIFMVKNSRPDTERLSSRTKCNVTWSTWHEKLPVCTYNVYRNLTLNLPRQGEGTWCGIFTAQPGWHLMWDLPRSARMAHWSLLATDVWKYFHRFGMLLPKMMYAIHKNLYNCLRQLCMSIHLIFFKSSKVSFEPFRLKYEIFDM